mmetsp:Transcript_16247/g.27589  ORF Transcript_16247/g.27589 Transcript_16247/m.27589 type:complete len:87 (-) Transcript_16247:253-513(-)
MIGEKQYPPQSDDALWNRWTETNERLSIAKAGKGGRIYKVTDCMRRQKTATLVGEKSQEGWFGVSCNDGKPAPLHDSNKMMALKKR